MRMRLVLAALAACLFAGLAHGENVAMFLSGYWDNPEVWVPGAPLAESDAPILTRDVYVRDAQVISQLHGPGWKGQSTVAIEQGGHLTNRGTIMMGIGESGLGCLVVEGGGTYVGENQIHVGRPHGQEEPGVGMVWIKPGAAFINRDRLWLGTNGGEGRLVIEGGGGRFDVSGHGLRIDVSRPAGTQALVLIPTADGLDGLTPMHFGDVSGMGHARLVVSPAYVPQPGDSWEFLYWSGSGDFASFADVETTAGLAVSVSKTERHGKNALRLEVVSVEAGFSPEPMAVPAESREQRDWWFEPFWRGDTVRGESCFLVENEAGVPEASLLFVPEAIEKVVHVPSGTVLEAGRDYTWRAGSKRIFLTKDTRAPFAAADKLVQPKGATGQPHADGEHDVLFAGGHWFNKNQIEVHYRHGGAWDGFTPEAAVEALPAAAKRIAEGGVLRMVTLGDSITRGGDASGFGTTAVAPYMRPYAYLFRDALERLGKGKLDVHLRNLAVGGTRSAWGVEQIGAVLAEKPDLLVLAFGMNDASAKIPTAEYLANIQAIIDGVRAELPETEIILVATMTGNEAWLPYNLEAYRAYRDGLREIAGKGIALADMTALWESMLAHKSFYDITGNGVNHPNDFGHRVYAQALAALLGG